MKWALGTALLLIALYSACAPSEVYSAADYHRDEVVRGEAGRQYRLRVQADHEASALDGMKDRLAAVRVPTTRASRSGHRSTRKTSGTRTRGCARQRTLAEIAAAESGGNYTAQNPRSSASGKYQVLDSTWAGYGNYRRAKDAPPEVQEQWAREAYAKSGSKPWRASGC